MTLNKKVGYVYRVLELINFEFQGDSGLIDKTENRYIRLDRPNVTDSKWLGVIEYNCIQEKGKYAASCKQIRRENRISIVES